MNSWISNLNFSRKFALIGALACAMFLVPTAVLVNSMIDRLQVALMERRGLDPSIQLLRLLQQSQQHRGLSAAFLGGSAATEAERQTRQSEVQKTLERTRETLVPLNDPKLLQSIDRITSEWQTLAASVAGKTIDAAASNQQHGQLISRELDLINNVSDSSGITLDPEAASFYVGRAVLLELPRLTEALGQMRARGAVLLARGSASPEDRARIESLAERARQYYENAGKSLEMAAGQAGLPTELERSRASALAAAQDGFKLADDVILRPDALTMQSSEWVSRMTPIIDAQFVLVNASFDMLQTSLRTQIASLQRNLVVLCGLLGTLAIAALWVMVMVTKTTTRSLGSAVRLSEAVAAGDLTMQVQLQGRDEVGRLLRAMHGMNQQLSSVVGSVRQNSESVATASAQIAQGNADLSQRTEEQASALQQTAASMEQLNSTVQQNADGARKASELARNASSVATQGGVVVQQVVETMQAIHASSGRIADIISVIEGIAFQTNILALNAAVEAARAGEQGRGFAVVASEVRSLAQRSANAAKEIKELITASVDQVNQGTQLADRAGTTMNDIVSAIGHVNDIVAGISAATAEQSVGIAQVGEAVMQMDTTTQQNAALVEESAAAANSLSGQAQQLVQVVAVFRLPQKDGNLLTSPSSTPGLMFHR